MNYIVICLQCIISYCTLIFPIHFKTLWREFILQYGHIRSTFLIANRNKEIRKNIILVTWWPTVSNVNYRTDKHDYRGFQKCYAMFQSTLTHTSRLSDAISELNIDWDAKTYAHFIHTHYFEIYLWQVNISTFMTTIYHKHRRRHVVYTWVPFYCRPEPYNVLMYSGIPIHCFYH